MEKLLVTVISWMKAVVHNSRVDPTVTLTKTSISADILMYGLQILQNVKLDTLEYGSPAERLFASMVRLASRIGLSKLDESLVNNAARSACLGCFSVSLCFTRCVGPCRCDE